MKVLPLYNISRKHNNIGNILFENPNNTTEKLDDNNYKKYSYTVSSIGRAELNFNGVTKITPDIIKTMSLEYASGKSLQQIAAILAGIGISVHFGHISKLLRQQPNYNEIKEQHIQNNQTKKIIITEKLSEEIKKEYAAGVSTFAIAKKYGCSRVTVDRIVNRSDNTEDLKSERAKNNYYVGHKVSSDDIKKIIQMYSDGYSTYQIGEVLKFSQSIIADYINAADNSDEIRALHAKNNKTEKFILTDEIRDKFVEHYKKGVPLFKIGEMFNCTPNSVISYLKTLDNFEEIEKEHKNNYQGISNLTEEQVLEIIRMYESGAFPKNIAKKLGCSPTTVKRHIKSQDNCDEIECKHYENREQRSYIGKTEITDEMIRKMIYLYAAGYPFKSIAKELKCSGTTVAKYVKGNLKYEELEKAHIKNNKSKLAIITDEKVDLIRSLYKSGETAEHIAVIARCSATTVSKYLKLFEDWENIKNEHFENYEGELCLLPEEATSNIIELYRAGKTMEELSKMFGCSHKTISNRIKLAENQENLREEHKINKKQGSCSKS